MDGNHIRAIELKEVTKKIYALLVSYPVNQMKSFRNMFFAFTSYDAAV